MKSSIFVLVLACLGLSPMILNLIQPSAAIAEQSSTSKPPVKVEPVKNPYEGLTAADVLWLELYGD